MAVETISIDMKNKSGVISCSPHILRLIREKFSVPNPSYKMKRFVPRRYIVTPSGAFEVGLWGEIENFIGSLNIPIKLNISDEFKRTFSPSFADYEIQNIDGFTYYDHQSNTIKEFLANGRGNGILATSSGKSVLIAGLIKTIRHYNPLFRFLIIVPNTGLVNQLYYSFLQEFNLPIISRWGDGNIPDWDSPVIIANSQILISDINDTVKKVKDFDVVIVDEVHRLGEKKNQINKVVHNIISPHKFGLTGTLPDNYMAAWNVIGKIGPILYEESSYNIRQKGTASEVDIKIIICKHQQLLPAPVPIGPNIPLAPTAFYDVEKQFLYTNTKRNTVICHIAKSLKGNALILVDLIDHGLILEQLCQSIEGKQTFFVQGSTDTNIRKDIIDTMEQTDNVICIAMSQIFSTGISINNLPFVIFSCIGKSTVKISQAIGRAMRLHKNKDKALIYDIADDTDYSMNHLRERIKLYKTNKYPFTIQKITI